MVAVVVCLYLSIKYFCYKTIQRKKEFYLHKNDFTIKAIVRRSAEFVSGLVLPETEWKQKLGNGKSV